MESKNIEKCTFFFLNETKENKWKLFPFVLLDKKVREKNDISRITCVVFDREKKKGASFSIKCIR